MQEDKRLKAEVRVEFLRSKEGLNLSCVGDLILVESRTYERGNSRMHTVLHVQQINGEELLHAFE